MLRCDCANRCRKRKLLEFNSIDGAVSVRVTLAAVTLKVFKMTIWRLSLCVYRVNDTRISWLLKRRKRNKQFCGLLHHAYTLSTNPSLKQHQDKNKACVSGGGTGGNNGSESFFGASSPPSFRIIFDLKDLPCFANRPRYLRQRGHSVLLESNIKFIYIEKKGTQLFSGALSSFIIEILNN